MYFVGFLDCRHHKGGLTMKHMYSHRLPVQCGSMGTIYSSPCRNVPHLTANLQSVNTSSLRSRLETIHVPSFNRMDAEIQNDQSAAPHSSLLSSRVFGSCTASERLKNALNIRTDTTNFSVTPTVSSLPFCTATCRDVQAIQKSGFSHRQCGRNKTS